MNKQLIKLLVIGLGFTLADGTLMAGKTETKKTEEKPGVIKSTWNKIYDFFASDDVTAEELKKQEDAKIVNRVCKFVGDHKYPILGVSAAAALVATGLIVFRDEIFGASEDEEETENTEKTEEKAA